MPPLLGPAAGDLLHVMTYNLRYPVDHPGHQWVERRPAMAALLNIERPALIGTQEGFDWQIREVVADLPTGYAWIGESRRRDGAVGPAIVYDTARLELVDDSNFWLSDTPDVPGSATWGNKIARKATWARFTDRATDARFVILNTHLDHRSASSRERAAGLLRTAIDSFGDEPVVVTGDFNAAAEDSAPYQVLVGDGGLVDAWRAARVRRTAEYCTLGAYNDPSTDGPRIDWILTTPEIAVDEVAINPTAIEGRYPSDHLPVQAHLRLPRPAQHPPPPDATR